jgi:hypothetical protein
MFGGNHTSFLFPCWVSVTSEWHHLTRGDISGRTWGQHECEVPVRCLLLVQYLVYNWGHSYYQLYLPPSAALPLPSLISLPLLLTHSLLIPQEVTSQNAEKLYRIRPLLSLLWSYGSVALITFSHAHSPRSGGASIPGVSIPQIKLCWQQVCVKSLYSGAHQGKEGRMDLMSAWACSKILFLGYWHSL